MMSVLAVMKILYDKKYSFTFTDGLAIVGWRFALFWYGFYNPDAYNSVLGTATHDMIRWVVSKFGVDALTGSNAFDIIENLIATQIMSKPEEESLLNMLP